jgi:phage terminase large subunit-like protein
LGVEFDEWQRGAGRLILAKRADGTLAVTVGGAHMSLPRQVGKTYLLAGLIFGLCVNTPGLLVIWTAQHLKTSGETFLAMQAFADRAKVKPFIDQVFVGSGDEEIRFTNGSRILFGARERGFGRGIPGVDILVMDEAQILSDKALENMVATLNTSSVGLQLYIGTPPKPDDIEAGRSEYFLRTRLEALSGDAEDLVWIECGADDNADPRDRKQWAKANASYPHRTPETSILRLAKKLTADGFLREGLGIWPSDDEVDVISVRRWSTAPVLDRNAEPPRRTALVIAASPNRGKACIGVAGEYDGRTLVMAHSLPMSQVAAKVAELKAAQDLVEVALAGAPPKGLKPQLVELGVEFEQLSNTEMGAACAAFQEAVKDGTVVHVGQPELDSAVAKAHTRMVGQSEQWAEDVEPALVACSGAFYRWGLQEAPLPAIY